MERKGYQRMCSFILSFFVVCMIFLLDRTTKDIALEQAVVTLNQYSLFFIPLSSATVVGVTGVFLCGVCCYLAKNIWSNGNIMPILATALFLGGAIGNLYDRITYGAVIDWIALGRISVINIADIAIFAGFFVLSLRYFNKTRS